MKRSHQEHSWFILVSIALCLFLCPILVFAQKTNDSASSNGFSEAPTLIKAKSLSLFSKERRFEYSGPVEVRQGDMLLTSKKLLGNYDSNNQIDTITALGNVVITKGESIHATSEKAVYERASETVTLTESPELHQEASILTADVVKIFLEEDRSVAEGEVRVKMVDENAKEKKNSRPLF